MSNNAVMAWLIPLHAAVATIALFLGARNLLRPGKGNHTHRVVGRIWMVAMYATVISSFAIRELRPGRFSFIHALSIFSFVTLTIALWAARTGRVRTHRNFVIGSYIGLVGAFIGAVVAPLRYIPQQVVHRPVEFALAVFGCVVVALGLIRLSGRERATP
jgi:uncharacterized membrane protein